MPSHRRSNEISKMDLARSVARHSTRQHLTYEQKLEIINFYHSHKYRLPLVKMVEPLRRRGFLTLHYTTIRRILDDEDRILRYASEHPNRLGYKHGPTITHQ
ncbi:hypothetical protein FRC12_011566 [Ceratobasidium sp. 428]|nr:hypothetical protein FRC12_011566 [Ceratobasidium sp. 428]